MTTKKLRIYAPDVTPRLEYTAGVIFDTILGISFELTTDRRRLGAGPAIFYSGEKVKDQFVIRPSGLLSATGISSPEPEVSFYEGMPMLCAVDEGSIPFDLF